jgi:hypothetical protein
MVVAAWPCLRSSERWFFVTFCLMLNSQLSRNHCFVLGAELLPLRRQPRILQTSALPDLRHAKSEVMSSHFFDRLRLRYEVQGWAKCFDGPALFP